MMRASERLLLVMVAAALAGPVACGAEYRVGVARRDITPERPIWMSGYGNRNKPSEGIEQHLFTKALVIEDAAGARSVLITADLIGVPAEFTEALAERLANEFGVPRERFMLVASHTHTGPVIYHSLGGMFALSDEAAETVRGNTDRCAERMFDAVAEAMNKLEPAGLSFGHGEAAFAANRRVFRPQGVAFGVNPIGPTDRDVPVLRVEDEAGKLRAIVFGYACHCTTLGGDYYRICGDWAGYAQEYLELAHPGATALFVTGCGADANPEPRGKLEQARQHGLEMAGCVAGVLSRPLEPVRGPIRAAFDHADLPLAEPPSRAEFEKRLSDKNVFVQRHAQRFLDQIDAGEELPRSYASPVQAWRFGDDLTLVTLGGEVVVDYALRLKEELGPERLWIAAYANDVFAYIPSARVLLEGGYEADFNMIYYGLPTRFAPAVEETLIQAVHGVIDRAAAEPLPAAGQGPAKGTESR